MCEKHSYQQFGKWLENCTKCGVQALEVRAWRADVMDALENRTRAPKHPYLVDGRWVASDYKKFQAR